MIATAPILNSVLDLKSSAFITNSKYHMLIAIRLRHMIANYVNIFKGLKQIVSSITQIFGYSASYAISTDFVNFSHSGLPTFCSEF